MSMIENIDLAPTERKQDSELSISDRVPNGNDHTSMALEKRIAWIKEKLDLDLGALSAHQIDPRRLRGVVENFIGAVQIPVGLAGPLRINGGLADGVFMAPFAIVEGTVTLSASRGARVINESGGIKVKVLQRQMSRVPVFQFENLEECEIFIQWIKQNYETIESECNKLSRYGMLDSIEHFIIGNTVHLKFSYSTGDAAGQNMVTIMTDNGTIWIRDQFENLTGIKIRLYALEGNISGDKKLNLMNLNSDTSVRGARVFTEVLLKKEPFERIFKCSIEQFSALANIGHASSAFSGTVGGLTINPVNVIAAIYAATGQDMGCLLESGSQNLFFEVRPDGIYWSCTFSSIVTGTKSNAAKLPTQQECLKLLGCTGEGGAEKLAEIIAAFCVALDISTLAAMANDTFSSAHRTFGRG